MSVTGTKRFYHRWTTNRHAEKRWKHGKNASKAFVSKDSECGSIVQIGQLNYFYRKELRI